VLEHTSSEHTSSWEVDRTLLAQLGLRRLGLLGQSPTFVDAISKLPYISDCDATVLISGATGTGKELVARTVHYLSPRHDHPFVPVDCGAIPAELAESELFGHERGAYTGAFTRGIGLIPSAKDGTLFLDEVDALSLSVQAKLLRFLQEREYRALGSTEIRRADVRVIAATNRELRSQVKAGTLREDLFYRLAVVQIRLPALKERTEDILVLARYFLGKYTAQFRRSIRDFSADAMEKLLHHDWPGNIRELENVVQAAVALCQGSTIESRHLPALDAGGGAPVSFRAAKAEAMSRFERGYIVQLLRACKGNISQAARAAQKNRRAFWELIRKHGIDPREYLDEPAGQRKSPGRSTRSLQRYSEAGS
jgi:DNA-binding NtrC family response regulator